MNIKNEINKLPRPLVNIIKNAGRFADNTNQRAYLVGGFIRDIFLKIKNFDVDIVLETKGINFARALNKRLKAKLIIHKRFGTAVIRCKNFKLDIATCRKEIYPYPGSLPVVSAGSLKDDLARRDFSINAMAVSINKDNFGQLFDFFCGLDAIRNKKLEILHKGSFLDDPIRILRLARFKARFGFSIDKATLKLIKASRGLKALENMQKHRVRDELVLMFKEARPEDIIESLKDLYGLGFIYKNLNFTKSDSKKFLVIRKVCLWFDKKFTSRRKPETWLMYLSVLLSRLPASDLKVIAREFGLKRGELIRIISFKKDSSLIERKLNNLRLPASKVYNILNPLSYEVILLSLGFSKSNSVRRHIENFLRDYNLSRIKSTGEDLKALGVRPGPDFKHILKRIAEEKLNKKLSSKRQELVFVKSLLKKIR